MRNYPESQRNQAIYQSMRNKITNSKLNDNILSTNNDNKIQQMKYQGFGLINNIQNNNQNGNRNHPKKIARYNTDLRNQKFVDLFPKQIQRQINDSIKQGTNKILIAVTAENGDVRYYRIFVNCTEK